MIGAVAVTACQNKWIFTDTNYHTVTVSPAVRQGIDAYSGAGQVVKNPTIKMTGAYSNGSGEITDYRQMVCYGQKNSDSTWVQLGSERHNNDLVGPATDNFDFTITVTDSVEYKQFRYVFTSVGENTYSLSCYVDTSYIRP